jgi:eukaryotic-like serine/threonine-protein kinase
LALTTGSRLGVYEVTAPIGEGGLGAVYRATDTSLGRQVAIKVLPDAFAQDPERLARFEREAKTLAALNHPHIAAIYQVRRPRDGERGPVRRDIRGGAAGVQLVRGAEAPRAGQLRILNGTDAIIRSHATRIVPPAGVTSVNVQVS